MSAFDPTSIGAVAVADEFDPVSLGAVPVDAPAAVSAPLARMTDTAQGTFGGLPETVAKLPNWEEHPVLDKARILGEHSRAFQNRIVNSNSLGSTIGGSLTAAAAMALAPESGGLSLLALGLAGATLGSEAGGQTQEAIRRTDETPAESLARGEELARQAEKYPATTQLADMAVNLPVFRPSPSQIVNTGRALGYLRLGATLPAAERQALTETLGAMGIGTGLAIGTHAASGEPLTVQDALMGGGQMAFLSKPTALGEALGFAHPPMVNPYAERAASTLEASGLPKAAEAMREAGKAPKAEEPVKPPERAPEAPSAPPEPAAEESAPVPPEVTPETTPEPPAAETNPPTEAPSPEGNAGNEPTAEGTAETTAQPGGGPTAIKNAQTAIERAARGLPAATEPEARTWEQARSEAAETIARDPEAPGRLVADLQATPRALNDTEDALLLHRQVQLQNEYDRLTTLTNQAIDAGDEGAVSELGERRNELLGHLQAIYDVDESVGTVASRGFNARKMAMASDFTLTKMLADKRADQGADLTPPEIARVEDLHRQIADLQAQVAAHESGKVDAESHAAMDEALAKMVGDAQAETAGSYEAPAEGTPLVGTRFKVGDAVNTVDNSFPKGAKLLDYLGDGTVSVETPDGQRWIASPDDLIAHVKPGAEAQSSLGGVPAVRVKAEEIASRPDLMQFKRMDDAATGINDADKLSGQWDDRKAGLLLLWEPANPAEHGLEPGQKYIVANGHHRLEFGERQGVKEFNAQVVREADGVSAQDARTLAAEINITDGKGTIYDQARFLRNYAAARGPDEAVAAGGRIGARGRKAASIAFSATDRLFDAFVNGAVTPEHAAAIAEAAPRNEAAQAAGLRAARSGKTPEYAANRAKAELIRPADAPKEFDLFGEEVFAEQDRQAEVATREQQRLSQELAAVRGAANRPELAAKHGVDVKDPEGVKRRIEALEAERERWKNWPSHPDLVAITRAEPVPEAPGAAPAAAPKLSKRAEKKSRVSQALDALQQKADEARARLEAKRQQPGAQSGPIDPTDLDDYAIIGANYFAKGATSFGRWAAKMVTDFGEAIRPHLQALWQRAKELHAQTVSPRDLNGERERIVRAVKERVEEGDSIADLGRLARGLAENYVRRGVTEREALVDAVHSELEPAMPGLTRQQTMDAISGYGDRKLLSKEAALVRLREIKGELREQAKLNDMANGLAPKASGVEQHQKGDEERRLGKLVHEAKKKGGFTVTDPATQLRSAAQAQETRLANELKDLTEEFALGKQVGETRQLPTTERSEMLKAMIARVKQSLKAVREVKAKSDEEILAESIKAANRSTAEYNRQVEEEDFVRKQGKPKLTSPEYEAAVARREAAKAERDEFAELDEAVKQRKQEAKTRQLADSVAEVDRKLKEGTPVEGKPAAQLTPEQEDLVMQRDAMLKLLAEVRRGPVKAEAEKQVEQLLKSVNHLDEILNNGGVNPKTGKAVEPLTPEAADLMMYREGQMRALREIRAAARPRRSDEEISLSRWKTNALRREADLKDRIARGDFAPKAKNPVVLDAEAQTTKARLEKLKQDWFRGREEDRLAKRPTWEKGFDAMTGINRGLKLTRLTTLAKLAIYSLHGVTLKPIYELAGKIAQHTPMLRTLSKLADVEGGGSLDALGGFYKGLIYGVKNDAMQPLRQALAILSRRRMGDIGAASEIKTLYAKEGVHLDPRWYDIPQLLHEAEKNPLKRADFEYAVKKLERSYEADGKDFTTPNARREIRRAAYEYAQRSILMNENRVSSAIAAGIRMLETPNKKTGVVTPAGKAGATVAHALMTFNRVSSNHVALLFNHVAGVPVGVARALANRWGGIENTHPETANSIIRQIKQGAPGAAMLALGLANPDMFGGLDHRKKRAPGEPEFGEINIGGRTFSRYWALAAPSLMAAQIGATITQTIHSKLRKHDAEEQGVAAGLAAGAAGVIESGPIVNEAARAGQLLEPGRRMQYLYNLIKSNVVPGLMDEVARMADTDPEGKTVKRKSDGFLESLEESIPGLRQNVRTKEEADKAAKRRR